MEPTDIAIQCADQEKRRTIYWNEHDRFLNLRLNWRASMMRHLFHILPGQKILEIGAGNGEFTRALNITTRKECEITAVVFSPKYYDKIKTCIIGNDINVKYLDSFPGLLQGNKFDYIIATHMLETKSLNEFLTEIKTLLKPGGGFLLFEPNSWNPYRLIRKAVQSVFPIGWKRPADPIVLNRYEMFYALSEMGYTQINIFPHDFLYSPIPQFLLWPVKNLCNIMENFPYLRNFAASLVIWGRNPALENIEQAEVDLCDHQLFFQKVSFVVPCHNEEMNIAPLIKTINRFFNKYIAEIIIVDDNSDDKTAEVAKKISKTDKRVSIIKRSPPKGVGRALQDGLKEAKGDYILIMDSDFQHIIPEMRNLFDVVAHGADVAVGSRFSRESILVNYAFTKIIANRFFHIIAVLIFRKRFRDISNNLKLFRRGVAKCLRIESNDFAANVETGLKPILMGYKVTEVPISWINRSYNMGLSSFKIAKTGPNYLKILLRLGWRHIFKQPYQKKR
jgi:SAM-dependent methyltransferase